MCVANLDEIDVLAWRFLCSACKCTCTSLPLKETRWNGDTGLEWTVGSLVACSGAGHFLTCHSTSDSLAPAANNIVLSIASISEAAGETATAHASTFGTRGAVNSSFARLVDTRTSGFLSRGFVSEGLDHSDRWTDCDAVTRVSNASHHLAIVASGALLDSELSEQSSSMGPGRFFPTLFGRTSNYHSSDSDMLQERTKPCASRAVFCWLSCAASSFRCFCASSC